MVFVSFVTITQSCQKINETASTNEINFTPNQNSKAPSGQSNELNRTSIDASMLSEDSNFIRIVDDKIYFAEFIGEIITTNNLSIDTLNAQLNSLADANLPISQQYDELNQIFGVQVSPTVQVHIENFYNLWDSILQNYSNITPEVLQNEVTEVYVIKYGENNTMQSRIPCKWRYYLCSAAVTAGAIVCHSACIGGTAGFGAPACVVLCGTAQVYGMTECSDKYCPQQ